MVLAAAGLVRDRPYRILFVCMGNVYRSPAAEVVVRGLLRDHGLGARVEVASAGTHAHRTGEACAARAQQLAWARGYDLSWARARKIGWQDFDDFDLILAMDRNNLDTLRRMATEAQQGKIRLFMDFATQSAETEILDPYTTLGGSFEHVLDLVEDAAKGLVARLEATMMAAENCPSEVG